MSRHRCSLPFPAVPSALVIGLIAVATPAFADDPAPAPAPAPSTEPAVGVEPAAATAGDPAAAAPPAEATVTDTAAPEAPASRFPRSVIARPLTLPKSLAMIGADATANHDFSTMGAAPILGYGITDKLEVQVPYTFTTKEFEGRGSLGLDVGYVIARGALDGKFEAIARVRGGYNTLDSVALPLMLGVHAQYNITPKIAIISGYAGTQQIRISLEEDADMATPVDISLPIGIGVQPTDEFYLQLDTKLAQINLSDSANAIIGADATPVLLTAVYNVIPALDVQAAIGTDLSNSPGDALSFLIGARYYAGQL
jgi:hypothetical protein